nr:cytochrome P450 [Catenulispora rubra]
MNPSRPAAAVIDAVMAPAGRADPFPLYAMAHQLGPVPVIADGAFLVCGYAAVDQVLRDPGFGLRIRPDAGHPTAGWDRWPGRSCGPTRRITDVCGP